MNISEVLLDAAELLWDGDESEDEYKEEYICHAIESVCRANGLNEQPAVDFLEEMGMELSGSGFIEVGGRRFTDYEGQQIRYAWLQLAAQVAEEEGL